MRLGTLLRSPLLGLAAIVLVAGVAAAQSVPNPVDLSAVAAGHGKVRLTVTAGDTGTPYGFTVCWMKYSDFVARGSAWPATWIKSEGWGNFTGAATLNTWGDAVQSFHLGAGEALDVEIGDLRDESGVGGTTTGELPDGEDMVFCAYPLGPDSTLHGLLSPNCRQGTTPQGHNCTYTQGYWKNHTGEWPATSIKLGSVNYTSSQLLSIFNRSVGGNGLVALAHQLIAAKLNLARGADASAVASFISSADALIGVRIVPPVGSGSLSPGFVSSLTQALDDYNNGLFGPGHCGLTPTHPATWGSLKSTYR